MYFSFLIVTCLMNMVQNAWWSLSRTDIYQALSFDVLLMLWLGIWGAHMWPILLSIISKRSLSLLDEWYAEFPHVSTIDILHLVQLLSHPSQGSPSSLTIYAAQILL